MKLFLVFAMLMFSACYVEDSSQSKTTSADGLSQSGSGQPSTLAVVATEDGVALRVDGNSMFFKDNKEHFFGGDHLIHGGWLDDDGVRAKVKEMLRFAYAALGLLSGMYKDYRHGRSMPDHISLRDLKNYLIEIDLGIKRLEKFSRVRRGTKRAFLEEASAKLEKLLSEQRLTFYGISYDQLFMIIGEGVVHNQSTPVTECLRPVDKYLSEKGRDVVNTIVTYVVEETNLRSKKVSQITDETVVELFETFQERTRKTKVVTVGEGRVEETVTRRSVDKFAERYRKDAQVREKFIEHVATRQVETRHDEENAQVTFKKFVEKDYREFHEKYREESIRKQTISLLSTVMEIKESKREQLHNEILADGYWRANIAKVLDLLMHRKELRDVSRKDLHRLAKILAQAFSGVTVAENF